MPRLPWSTTAAAIGVTIARGTTETTIAVAPTTMTETTAGADFDSHHGGLDYRAPVLCRRAPVDSDRPIVAAPSASLPAKRVLLPHRAPAPAASRPRTLHARPAFAARPSLGLWILLVTSLSLSLSLSNLTTNRSAENRHRLNENIWDPTTAAHEFAP
jgi:hypothetical protein